MNLSQIYFSSEYIGVRTEGGGVTHIFQFMQRYRDIEKDSRKSYPLFTIYGKIDII